MKRKVVMRLLCVSIASAMLVSNTAVLVASGGTRTAIYNGQQMTVTVNGEQVILPDGQIISIYDCQLVAAEPAPTQEPAPEPVPAPKPEPAPEPAPTPDTPGTETPDTPGTETPDTPDTETPDMPDTETPDTPDTETPDTPDTETPDTPDTETPDTPDTVTPDPPDTETPDTPDTETPDTPDTETPDIPDVEVPDGEETLIPIVPAVKPVPEEEKSSTISKPAASDAESTPSLSVTAPSLKAGIGFYVDELKDTYHLEFSENFAEMLAEIEEQYVNATVAEAIEIAARKAEAEKEAGEVEQPEAEEEITSKVQVAEGVVLADIKAEELTVSIKNWQDVLAVYLLEQSRAGVTEFKLDDSCKARLAELLDEMNTPTITAEELVCEPQYMDAYLEANRDTLTDGEAAFLSEYTSSSFSLLCSAATGAEGFILESLGEDVSAERAQVVAAGYSLVGKIPYFWGGKSSVVGWDDRWGSPTEVTAAGTTSSGTIRNYGLDCSGFVTWAFVNGYENSAATSLIGHGTATQWAMSEAISEEDALPGDLVFLQQPNAAGINHVGIVVGRNDDGSLIAVHCNAGQNGVTVDSAYQAGFRYVRRPLAYTDDEARTLTGKQVRLQELKETISEENAKLDS